jgi:hypothetical protein
VGLRDAASAEPDPRRKLSLYGEFVAEVSLFAPALHQDGHSAPTSRPRRPATCSGPATHPEVYELLVIQRGWTPERYGRRVADTLIAALLP